MEKQNNKNKRGDSLESDVRSTFGSINQQFMSDPVYVYEKAVKLYLAGSVSDASDFLSRGTSSDLHLPSINLQKILETRNDLDSPLHHMLFKRSNSAILATPSGKKIKKYSLDKKASLMSFTKDGSAFLTYTREQKPSTAINIDVIQTSTGRKLKNFSIENASKKVLCHPVLNPYSNELFAVVKDSLHVINLDSLSSVIIDTNMHSEYVDYNPHFSFSHLGNYALYRHSNNSFYLYGSNLNGSKISQELPKKIDGAGSISYLGFDNHENLFIQIDREDYYSVSYKSIFLKKPNMTKHILSDDLLPDDEFIGGVDVVNSRGVSFKSRYTAYVFDFHSKEIFSLPQLPGVFQNVSSISPDKNYISSFWMGSSVDVINISSGKRYEIETGGNIIWKPLPKLTRGTEWLF